jgi:hypothetical protein
MDLGLTDEEVQNARDLYLEVHGDLTQLLKDGLLFDQFVGMMGLGFLLKVIPVSGAFEKFNDAFLAAIDIWLYLDKNASGVLVVSDVQKRLDELPELAAFISVDKIKTCDPNNSDFVPFSQYVTPCLHWLDPTMDDV